ncbi:MAG: dimethylmenaquinone methyltransferase [Gemmatimonadetes bacterium]|nr:dimethylmenaquinone methyltransferase [Gemmatimonadota bacterium]
MNLNNRENIVDLTPENQYERFEDGRPKVPDDILRRMRKVTTEEAWGVLQQNGYHQQFEGSWLTIHPDRILVGRAVTGRFVPTRPDLDAVITAEGASKGRIGGQNSWVIDTLVEDDVIVIELFGKVVDGTFAGDNLSTAIAANTGGTGMIVDGGMRDFQRVIQLPEFNGFIKGLDPTPIRNVTLTEINGPVRIGNTTALPGDVVLGTPTGVIFIPPHLAEPVVKRSESVRLRDYFGQLRIREGIYTPGEVDRKWSDEMEADFEEWGKTNSLDDINL